MEIFSCLKHFITKEKIKIILMNTIDFNHVEKGYLESIESNICYFTCNSTSIQDL